MPSKSTPRALRHAPEFRRRLLRWFRRHGRDLPWRRTRDPYHITVSEFMLQQTQVVRVQEYYQAFLTRYPTIQALAAARPGAVRESWEGLGYYRRAANLHRLAQAVVEEYDGIIPSDPEQLGALPGVGRYTAGAVASFAYERATPVVDTNVARVLRRAFHPRIRLSANHTRLWETAGRLMPRRGKTAWAFNQALMELGAVVCTARSAKCEICPVRQACKTGRLTSPRPRGPTGRRRGKPRRSR